MKENHDFLNGYIIIRYENYYLPIKVHYHKKTNDNGLYNVISYLPYNNLNDRYFAERPKEAIFEDFNTAKKIALSQTRKKIKKMKFQLKNLTKQMNKMEKYTEQIFLYTYPPQWKESK